MNILSVTDLAVQVPQELSPSKINWILKCPLRGLYSNSLNSPYFVKNNFGSLGNVIHKIFKASNANQIRSNEDFDRLWDKFEHEELSDRNTGKIRSYGKYKFLTRREILKFNQGSQSRNGYIKYKSIKFIPEIVISDEIIGIRGQLDLLILLNGQPFEVKDYKTGEIFDLAAKIESENHNVDHSEMLKQEYKNQLLLYAWLVNKKYGRYPQFLTIVAADGFEVKLECKVELVENLINEVRTLRANFKSLDQVKLAAPCMDNCKYCSFRPSCPSAEITAPSPTGDFRDTVVDCKIHQYGSFTIQFKTGIKFFYSSPLGKQIDLLTNLPGKSLFLSMVKWYKKEDSKLLVPTNYTNLYIIQ